MTLADKISLLMLFLSLGLGLAFLLMIQMCFALWRCGVDIHDINKRRRELTDSLQEIERLRTEIRS